MKNTSVGIDLAWSVFAVHGIDEHGKPALTRLMRVERCRESCTYKIVL